MTFERELQLTAERLHHLAPARLLSARNRFEALLARMAERPVPQLAPRAWGDQLLVIGREVPPAQRPTLADALREFRRSLDLTP